MTQPKVHSPSGSNGVTCRCSSTSQPAAPTSGVHPPQCHQEKDNVTSASLFPSTPLLLICSLQILWSSSFWVCLVVNQSRSELLPSCSAKVAPNLTLSINGPLSMCMVQEKNLTQSSSMATLASYQNQPSAKKSNSRTLAVWENKSFYDLPLPREYVL